MSTNPFTALIASASLASVPPVAPAKACFIRLGPGGCWARRAIETGTLRFGVSSEPHDLCLAGDWDGARAELAAFGIASREIGQLMRELRDVYTLGPDVLWITFAEGRLWWGFAEAEMIDLRQEEDGNDGIVARRIAGGWRDRSIGGRELVASRLSSRVTRVGAYGRTTCQVAEIEALCRAINDGEDEAVAPAVAAEKALVETVAVLIRGLDQSDFEVLGDLLLARLGWQRGSRLGGNLADADLFVEQPATGERALVQVKSRATQAVLDDTIGRTADHGCDRLFFLCHSPEGGLDARNYPGAHVWTGRSLAEQVAAAGLAGWVIDRAQ